MNKPHFKLEELEYLKTLSKCTFGDVKLVRNSKNYKLYALKSIPRGDYTISDIKSISKHSHPSNESIVRQISTLDDSIYLYSLMTYYSGGDLKSYLMQHTLSETQTKYFAKEIAEAINHVHSIGVTMTFLQPRNIMINPNGGIALSDFPTMNKFKNDEFRQLKKWQKYSNKFKRKDINNDDENKDNDTDEISIKSDKYYCTTPEYIAWDCLYLEKYDERVDWWSLGIILFECLFGYTPFYNPDPLIVCKNIIYYENTLQFPKNFHLATTIVAKKFLEKLICSRWKRMKYPQIKAHLWYDKYAQNDINKVIKSRSDDDAQHFYHHNKIEIIYNGFIRISEKYLKVAIPKEIKTLIWTIFAETEKKSADIVLDTKGLYSLVGDFFGYVDWILQDDGLLIACWQRGSQYGREVIQIKECKSLSKGTWRPRRGYHHRSRNIRYSIGIENNVQCKLSFTYENDRDKWAICLEDLAGKTCKVLS